MAKTTKVIRKTTSVKVVPKATDISKVKIEKDEIKVIGLPVTFTLPKGGMFVASWARVPVKIDPQSGIKMDDLRFEVKEGPIAGQISPCRDRLYDPAKPNIMLIAGPRAGKYTLEAFKKGAAKAVGSAQFVVTDLWTKADTGPSFCAMGVVKRPPGVTGATWGGGTPDTGPQNSNTIPASGDRNVAVILIDTSSERYSANPAGDIQTWEDALLNGKADTVDGITRSVQQFYKEVSYDNLNVIGTVFGPVQLPDAWDDYFEVEPASQTDAFPDIEHYNPKAGYYESAVAAAQDLVDFSQFQFVAFVVKSFVSGTPKKFYWPRAGLVQTTAIKKDGAGKPVTYNVSCMMLSMPVDWEAVRPNRQVTDTLMHELGHTLGLGDLYTPKVAGRNMGAWDPMDSEDPDPHFSLPARLMLGWVQPDWIEPFNFQKLAPPVDKTVTLHAIELGNPPAGRKSGIEIRITDGKNYYFEYRSKQAGHVGDVNLPVNKRVLGTDMISSTYTAPNARPQILLLPKHPDDDGAVLGNGQKYAEDDNTPGFPAKLIVDVSNADATKADVRVRYGIIGTPDPAIRPWPASPDNPWQSPDIEVRNERSMADPAFFNTPWLGHNNTVVAKVTNQGSADAPQVTVNFSVKDYTVTNVPEEPLGSDVKDVPAGATVEFSAPWSPPFDGHFCTVARIKLYQNPTTLQVEASQLNNEAQSNYDYFIAANASPAERQIASVSVSNPYKKRTRVHLVMAQTHPFYRTYLATKMLTLDPGEVRKVEVMFESYIEIDASGPRLLSTSAKQQTAVAKPDMKLMAIPNNAMVVGIAEDPRTAPERSLQILGGAQARIATGRGTRFKEFKAGKESCSGRVVTADGKGVAGGKVIVTLKGVPGAKGETYVTTKVNSTGDFRGKLPPRWKTAQAYYLPLTFLSDRTSEVVKQ